MQIQTLFCKKSDQKTTLFCKKSDQNTGVFCKKSDQKYPLGNKKREPVESSTSSRFYYILILRETPKLKYGLPQHLVYGEITAQLYT